MDSKTQRWKIGEERLLGPGWKELGITIRHIMEVQNSFQSIKKKMCAILYLIFSQKKKLEPPKW